MAHSVKGLFINILLYELFKSGFSVTSSKFHVFLLSQGLGPCLTDLGFVANYLNYFYIHLVSESALNRDFSET